MFILIGSFYSFWQKNSITEHTSAGETVATKTVTPEERTPEIIVYISGAVQKTGVFKLPNTARVIDVVTVAGGLSVDADLAKINMAQPLKDGMHVHVLEKVVLQSGSEGGAENHQQVNRTGKVNINTGDKSAFDTLPGVGPALAERIVEYRQANGSFSNVEELKKIPGIGQSKFEKMKEKLTI